MFLLESNAKQISFFFVCAGLIGFSLFLVWPKLYARFSSHGQRELYYTQVVPSDDSQAYPHHLLQTQFDFYGNKFEWNELGFRGPLVDDALSDDLIIAVIGDFATLALDLPDAQTLPMLLRGVCPKMNSKLTNIRWVDLSISPRLPDQRFKIFSWANKNLKIDWFVWVLSSEDILGFDMENISLFRNNLQLLRQDWMLEGQFGVIPVVRNIGSEDKFQSDKVDEVLRQEGFSPILLLADQSPSSDYRQSPTKRYQALSTMAIRICSYIDQRKIYENY